MDIHINMNIERLNGMIEFTLIYNYHPDVQLWVYVIIQQLSVDCNYYLM